MRVTPSVPSPGPDPSIGEPETSDTVVDAVPVAPVQTMDEAVLAPPVDVLCADDVEDITETDVDEEDEEETILSATMDKDADELSASTGDSSPRRRWWWAAAAMLFVVPVVGLLGFYAADRPVDAVARGVRVDGTDLSQRSASSVRSFVDERAQVFASTPVEFITGQGAVEATAEEVGLAVDVDRTVEAILDERNGGGFIGGVASWIGSFAGVSDVDLHVTPTDDDTIRSFLDGVDSDLEFEPAEPVLSSSPEGYELEPAVAGQRFVSTGLAAELPSTLSQLGDPIEVSAELTLVPTEIPGDVAERATADLNALTEGPLTIRVLGEAQTAHPATLRRWLQPELTADGHDLSIDDEAVMGFLERRFVAVDRPGQDATFTLEDGEPVILAPTFEGITCCTEDSASAVFEAIEADDDFVRLSTRSNPSERSLEWAESMGVVELVGEFTSRHACCQGRVTNIQRIADLTRGAFIEPGEMFSLNDHVGQRTAEKGFVGGGVIYNGEFTEDIGGGISQFVTTLFNAAFFGGLDFGEYKSHSKYISRYPYGREATISWRKPEFEIINTTPHGVMIWTEYTSNSITVKLYSTTYATGEQTGQSRYRHGNCTDVTTERTRTYADGSTEVDTVMAYYIEGTSGRC